MIVRLKEVIKMSENSDNVIKKSVINWENHTPDSEVEM